ncbi:DNA primase domain protein [Streptococcus pneumoniae 8190-05]|nr:DNA primase domain protein [Streptococcus pneumoniae 8190-05]
MGINGVKENSYIVNEGKKNERVEIPRPSVAIVDQSVTGNLPILPL